MDQKWRLETGNWKLQPETRYGPEDLKPEMATRNWKRRPETGNGDWKSEMATGNQK